MWCGHLEFNLVDYFLKEYRVELVRVLDDGSNRYYENIAEFDGHTKV